MVEMTRFRVVILKEDIPEPLVLKADTQALHPQLKVDTQGPHLQPKVDTQEPHHQTKVDILVPSQQLRLKFSNGLML